MVVKGIFFKLVVVAFLTIVCLSCSNSNPISVEDNENTKQEVVAQMKYICPMSCIKGKNEAGTCDTCGMNLVLNKNYKENSSL